MTDVVLGLVNVMVMFVAPFIGMVVALKPLAAIRAGKAAWMGMAPSDHGEFLLDVQDIVVLLPVASSVLPSPFTHPAPPPGAGFHLIV